MQTIHIAKPLAFSLHYRFRRDQNHYSNLTSKILKMCEQILKKHNQADYVKFSWKLIISCDSKSTVYKT